MLLKPLDFWKKRPELRRILLLAAIFFSLTLVLALNRYYSLYATFDQGLFNQLFWNSIHGRLFQGSLSSVQSSAFIYDGQLPSASYYHLGQHFVIDFLLWLPIYALFPSPVTLVVLQVALIAAGGLILYALARHYLSPPLAALITASFYAANTVIGPTLGNFYEHCQLPLFVFGLLLALEKRRWWLFWILVALTLGVREEAGIILFGIGVYLLVSRRYPRLGLALCAISFSYVVVVTNVIMPMFSNDNSRLYLATYFKKFVKSQNPTTLELFWGMVSQPSLVIEVFFSHFDGRWRYFLNHWLPLGLVPAISPAAWTMAGFPLIVLFVQIGNSGAFSPNTRYALTIVPGLFYGAILWWSQHSEKFKPRFRRFWSWCIALSLFFTITSNPHQSLFFLVPYSIQHWVYVSWNQLWEHVEHLQAAMKSIPPDARVSTTTYVIPHLSSRREIIRLPVLKLRNEQGKIIDVDYALVDMWLLQQHKFVSDIDRDRLKAVVPVIDQVLAQGKYGMIDVEDGVLLLQKGVPSEPKAKSDWLKLREELQPVLQSPK